MENSAASDFGPERLSEPHHEGTKIAVCPVSLLALDDRITKAMRKISPLRLSWEELSLLARIGLTDILGELRSQILKEIQCPKSRASTVAVNSGLITSGGTVSRFPVRSTSSGTIRRPEKSEGRARARTMFG